MVSDPTTIVTLNGVALTGLTSNIYYQFENREVKRWEKSAYFKQLLHIRINMYKNLNILEYIENWQKLPREQTIHF